jgi:hypothetical protein
VSYRFALFWRFGFRPVQTKCTITTSSRAISDLFCCGNWSPAQAMKLSTTLTHAPQHRFLRHCPHLSPVWITYTRISDGYALHACSCLVTPLLRSVASSPPVMALLVLCGVGFVCLFAFLSVSFLCVSAGAYASPLPSWHQLDRRSAFDQLGRVALSIMNTRRSGCEQRKKLLTVMSIMPDNVQSFAQLAWHGMHCFLALRAPFLPGLTTLRPRP